MIKKKKCNNTYHIKTKMKTFDVNSNTYIASSKKHEFKYWLPFNNIKI